VQTLLDGLLKKEDFKHKAFMGVQNAIDYKQQEVTY
jgi:hypothetical protein